jgi:hypothetical protein
MRRLLLLAIFLLPFVAKAQVPSRTQPAFRDTIKPRKDTIRVDTTEYWRDSLFKEMQQKVLKEGARPPKTLRKVRKFKIRYSDRLQYGYLIDYPLTAAAGVTTVLSFQKQLGIWEDGFLPKRLKYDTTQAQLNKAFAYRLGKIFLIDAPLETILATIESEFYGSMGRTREFALKGSSYSFKPANLFSFWKPAGGMTYDREAIENDASRMQLAQISGAAIDASSMASEQLALRWMQRKSLTYHESMHMLRTQMSTLASVLSISESPQTGTSAAGDWLYYTNREFGNISKYNYSAFELKRDYVLATLSNPMIYTALYSVFSQYLIHGNDSIATPAVKLGYGAYALPWVRLGLSPFGPEWIPSLTLTKHRQMIQFYARIGTNVFTESYAGGIKLFDIKRNTKFSLNAHITIWKQRYFFRDWINQKVEPIYWGGAGIVSGNFQLTKHVEHPISLMFHAGYKTRGYMEGEVWDATPILKVGLSVALDKDYTQDDTVPEYIIIPKKKKKAAGKKRRKRRRR